MHIMVTHTQASLALAWQRALSARFPQATVSLDVAAQSHSKPASDPTPSAHRAAPAEQPTLGVGWEPAADFFSRFPQVRGFFSAAAGVEHVLRNPSLPADLPVIRLEDAGMGVQMVEYCLHAVIRLRSRIGDYEQQQRDKVWEELAPLSRQALRIGVFGVGVLGAQVAKAFVALGYSVAGFARSKKSIDGLTTFHGDDGLAAFLARTDVLILLAPLTAQTQRIVNAATLRQLPRGAYLINVARGGLLDDIAVLEALDSGQLSGAALDVFNPEPLPKTQAYWTHPKVRMTPHISAITEVESSADQVAAKIQAWSQGAAITGVVDRQRGY